MVLESLVHQESSFVTLTYAPENLPRDGSLVPSDLRNWLKRLRKSLYPTKVRFFACGEYGDQTERPHYHAALFGVGQFHESVINKAWGLGFTMTAEFNQHTAQYIAGYVIKKMTQSDDFRLKGRHPEFSRMSNRPGIGAPAMAVIAEQLFTPAGVAEFQRTGDVPRSLLIGGRQIPLGKYLRRVLRDAIGMDDSWKGKLTEAFFAEKQSEMLALLGVKELDSGSTAGTLYKALGTKGPLASLIKERDQGKIWSVEARSKIVKKGKTL